MTRNSELKRRIRERMKRTGERYTAARAQVLKGALPEAPADRFPGLFEDYGSLGGTQSDSALLARVFAHSGIVHPGTGRPYSEAMVNGLCGGVGFLYAVFEYKGHPPMLSVVLRSRSMPATFIEGVFGRVGAQRTVKQTTSAKVAAKALEDALDQRRASVCVADLALLPYTNLPPQMVGMCPQYVGVVGSDGDRVWLDDRSIEPLAVTRAELEQARAGYRRGKHELFTVEPADGDVDWQSELRDAIRDTARTLRDGDPTVPASFRANCGIAGMRKWQSLLTDVKGKKAWCNVFASAEHALVGLRRAYDGLQHDYTAPAGGRPFYAEFLDEAGELLPNASLTEATDLFRESGAVWAEMANAIASAPDEAVQMACRRADLYAEALDSGEVSAQARGAEGDTEACVLDAEAASEVYGRMAECLGRIADLESRAADALEAGVA